MSSRLCSKRYGLKTYRFRVGKPTHGRGSDVNHKTGIALIHPRATVGHLLAIMQACQLHEMAEVSSVSAAVIFSLSLC
jgi:hypothetical protein